MFRSWVADCLMTTLCCRGRSLRRSTDVSELHLNWTIKVSLKEQRYRQIIHILELVFEQHRQLICVPAPHPILNAAFHRTPSWTWSTQSWHCRWKYMRPRASSTKSSIPARQWGRVGCCSARGRRKNSRGYKRQRFSCSWNTAVLHRCQPWMLHKVRLRD